MTNGTRTAEVGGGRRSRLADEDLISLVAEGDAGALSELYGRHARAAYYLSYRMTGERQAAEDLTQDAFLKAWRGARSYRPERGSVRTWILSIVHNRGIDRLRSSVSRARTREKAEAEAPGSQPSDAFERAWANHRGERVREALRGIPREQREVLALLHFRGLTHKEISERLRLPLGTVKREGARAARSGEAAQAPRGPGGGSRVAGPADGHGPLFARVRGG